jgi:hypothetical protein
VTPISQQKECPYSVDYDRGRGVCPTMLARWQDRDMNFFGRSANVTASLPYGVGAYRVHVQAAMGLAGREFLVWRRDDVELSSERDHGTKELPNRRDSLDSHYQESIGEDKL